MFKRYISVVFKKDLVTLKLLEEATHSQIMDQLKVKLVPLKRLYKEEIVQKYFQIEREIQSELNDVAKRIAKSISERFK